MTEATLAEIKQVELDILKEFIRVCEKLQLRYFAIDGTVLGAVRHRGFIPWDDDIDVGMPRKDYEIFMAQAQSYLKAPYFLQNLDTDAGYLRGFAKIRNSQTAFIERAARHLPINHGIYIDIFPLDGYAYSKIGEIGFKIKKTMYDDKIASGFHVTNAGKLPWKTACISTLCSFLSAGTTPKQAAYKREYLSKKHDYDACNTVGSLYDSIYTRELVPKAWFGEGKMLPFEDVMIRVPAEPEKYLAHMYGDYRQFPPESERVAQHVCDVIDVRRSYRKFI